MKENPLVSIIINNYNYGHFLKEAIDSALSQTYVHREVIVVDDGSTDDSRQIITSYGDKIVPVLKENGGQASAFNAGFAASRGYLICFLDSDDIFLPEKVEEILEVFREYPEIGWCFHSLSLQNNDTKDFLKNSHECLSGKWDYRSHIEQGKKLRYIPTTTSGLCFNRSLLEIILPMPEAIRITSDNYIKFIALAHSQGFFLNKDLTIQRIHNNNAYTLLKKDRQKLKAKIFILTAYWMRLKFPSLSKFANGLFVTGISLYWQSKSIEVECQELIRNYLSSLGLLERLKIQSKAFYVYLKIGKLQQKEME